VVVPQKRKRNETNGKKKQKGEREGPLKKKKAQSTAIKKVQWAPATFVADIKKRIGKNTETSEALPKAAPETNQSLKTKKK